MENVHKVFAKFYLRLASVQVFLQSFRFERFYAGALQQRLPSVLPPDGTPRHTLLIEPLVPAAPQKRSVKIGRVPVENEKWLLFAHSML